MKRMMKKLSKPMLWFVLIAFFFNTIMTEPLHASELNLPPVGQMVPLSPSFAPPMLHGIKVFKDNPFKFEFIIAQGDARANQIKEEANQLVRYFLASLTIPEEDMWVNLSPYEKDRISTKEFGVTDMGKDLLSQDYLLKQVTASVMYPEGKVGKEFWDKIYKEAAARFGTTSIPVSTFNKVWIVPGTALVFENPDDNTAVVLESKLKVMLEEDYLALDKSVRPDSAKQELDKSRQLSNELIREIILPHLEKEVNEGANFAVLRQVYHSLILAFWFKKKLKQSLLAKGYVDQKKTNGVDVEDKQVNQAIYKQYLKSYKKGVYNYIKEDLGPDNQVIPRKYFSGGFHLDPSKAFISVEGKRAADKAMVTLNGFKKLFMVAMAIASMHGIASGQDSPDSKDGSVGVSQSVQVEFSQKQWEKSADVLSAIVTGAVQSDAFHQTAEELLSLEAIIINGKASSKDALGRRDTLSSQDTITIRGDILKDLDLEKLKYKGSKAASQAAQAGTLKGTVFSGDGKRILKAIPVPETDSGSSTTAVSGSPSLSTLLSSPDFQNNANFLVDQISSQTGVTIGHQSVLELLQAKALSANGQVITDLTLKSLNPTDSISPDFNKIKELKGYKYMGTKNLVKYAQTKAPLTTASSDVLSASSAPTASGAAPPGGDGPPPPPDDIPGTAPSTAPMVAPVTAPAAAPSAVLVAPTNIVPSPTVVPSADMPNVAPASVPSMPNVVVPGSTTPAVSGVGGDTVGTVNSLTALTNLMANAPAVSREEQIAKVQTSIGDLKSQQADILKANQEAAAAETRGNAFRAQEAFKGAEGVLRAGIQSPVTEETARIMAAQINKTTHTPAVSVATPFGAAFILNGTSPFAVSGQGGRWAGSVQGTVLDINGKFGLNFIAGVPMPMGDALEIGQILSAGPLTATGALVITDDALKIIDGLQGQKNLGQTSTFVRKVDNLGEGLARSLVSTTHAYAFDRNRLLANHDLKVRLGPAVVFEVASKRIFRGVRNVFRRETPAQKEARELANPKPLYPWQNLGTTQYNSTHQWGSEEMGFYKDAYTNSNDTSFRFVVVERTLTEAVIDIKERKDLQDLINLGYGYAEGWAIHRQSNGKSEKRLAFRSLRYPGEFRPGQMITVTTEAKYKANVAKEIRAHQDRDVVGIGRSKADGGIQKFYGRDNIPVLNQADVNSSSTLLFEPTARGSQMQFWLNHSADQSYEVSLSDGSNIGEARYNKKLGQNDVRVRAFDGQRKTTVLANGMEVTTSRVTLGGRERVVVRSVIMRAPAKGKIPIGAIISGNTMKIYYDSELDAFRKASLTGRTVYGVEYERLNKSATEGWGQLINPATGKAVEVKDGRLPLMTQQEQLLADQNNRIAPVNPAGQQSNNFVPKVVNPGNKGVGINAVGSYVEDSVGSWGRGILQFLRVKDYKKRAPVDAQSFDQRYNRQVDGVASDVQSRIESLGKSVRGFSGAPAIPIKKVDLPVDSQGNVLFAGKKMKKFFYDAMFGQEGQKGLFYADREPFEVATNLDGVKPISALDAQQQAFAAQVAQEKGLDLTGDTTVKIKNGKLFIFKPSLAVQEAYRRKLQVEQQVLDAGGLEILELMEDGEIRAFVYAKGEATPEQVKEGIRSESEMVGHMSKGRVRIIHVKPADGRPEFDQQVIVPELEVKEFKLPFKEEEKEPDKAMISSLMSFLRVTLFAGSMMSGLSLNAQDGNNSAALPKENANVSSEEVVKAVDAIKSDSSIEQYLASHYMIVWKNSQVEFVTLNSLRNKANDQYLREHQPIEIVKIQVKVDAKGSTVSTVERVVKIFGQGYTPWKVTDLPSKLSQHALIVLKDGQGAEFVSLEQLKDPKIHAEVRKVADEIRMQDADQKVTARIYLNSNPQESRIEVIQKDGTSLIYSLDTYNPASPSNPIQKTKSEPKEDGLHITITELLDVNAGIEVENVFKTNPDGTLVLKNGKPIKLYSNRPLQSERIYFDEDGHETYSVSTDTNKEQGQTVLINGQEVNNVTGLYSYDSKTDSGYHLSLRDMQRNGGFQPIRLSQFKNGRMEVDQKGFFKFNLKKEASFAELLMKRVQEEGVLNVKDEYHYKANGSVDHRDVSFLIDVKGGKEWKLGWTLKPGRIGTQSQLVRGLPFKYVSDQKDPSGKPVFSIDENTVFVETIRTDAKGVVFRDLRVQGDALERKIVTMFEEDGLLMRMVLGTKFDPITGEQIEAIELTPDGQTKLVSSTVPNNQTYRELLPVGVERRYADFMQQQYGILGADFWKDMARSGISPTCVPRKVQKTAKLIQTVKPTEDGYRAMRDLILPLVLEHNKTTDLSERAKIKRQIEGMFLKYQRELNVARYTDQNGDSAFDFLLPPNDPRGVAFLTLTHEGNLILNNYHREGIDAPMTVLPSSIVLDPQGQLYFSSTFRGSSKEQFQTAQGRSVSLGIYSYTVSDHPLKHVGDSFTSIGDHASGDDAYARNQPLNLLDTQTRGVVRQHFYPLDVVPVPIYQTLVSDTRPDDVGKMTRATYDVTLTIEDGRQHVKVIEDVLDPTSNEIHKTKVQEIGPDGKPIISSIEEKDPLDLWVKDLKSYWFIFPTIIGGILGVFLIGALGRKIRKQRIIRNILGSKDAPWTVVDVPAPVVQLVPAQGPSFNSYGFAEAFGEGATITAEELYQETFVEELFKRYGVEESLRRRFEGHNIWRKHVLGINEPLVPSVEDLWVSLLVIRACGIANMDLPDLRNYLIHHAIQAVRQGQGADVGGFIHKMMDIFTKIISVQNSTFDSTSSGVIKGVLPRDLYITVDDMNDWFLTPGFVQWFDSLSPTIDAQRDLRQIIYDNILGQLKVKGDALKAALERIGSEVNNDPGAMKRLIAGDSAYDEYVDIFRRINQGVIELSEDGFAIDAAQLAAPAKEKAQQLIDMNPALYKTHGEGSLPVGKVPLLIRWIKPFAQMVRNNFNRYRNLFYMSAGTLLVVAASENYMSPSTALITAAIGVVSCSIIFRLLGAWLDKDINFKAHGAPLPFWTGYDQAKPPSNARGFQTAFWGGFFVLFFGLNAFLDHHFLITHFKTVGSQWHPWGVPFNLNFILMGIEWLTAVSLIAYIALAARAWTMGVVRHINLAWRGVGSVKTYGDIAELRRKGVLVDLVASKFLPESEAFVTSEQRTEAVEAILGRAVQFDRRREDVSDAQNQIENGSAAIETERAQVISSLFMDGPRIARVRDQLATATFIPVYGEDLNIAYDDPKTNKPIKRTLITALLGGQNILENLIAEGVLRDDPGTDKVRINEDLDTKKEIVKDIAGDQFDYLWKEILKKNEFSTALDMWTDMGYTNLNLAISKAPERWKNLCERMERESIATAEELERMRALQPGEGEVLRKGKLGAINDRLKMQIRLWASYQGQPLIRTVDGLMNIVRHKQHQLHMEEPNLSMDEVRAIANNQFQLGIAYQIAAEVLSAGEDRPDLQQKREDINYIARTYYEELGYTIDITSLEIRHGSWYKVRYRYNPAIDAIQEDVSIKLTSFNPILVEGKPSNMREAIYGFLRKRYLFTCDMNQDLMYLGAINLIKVMERFKGPNPPIIINVPEIIPSTGSANTPTGRQVSGSEESFSGPFVKGGMGDLQSAVDHGHGNVVDMERVDLVAIAKGNVIPEDYLGGLEAMLRGVTVQQASEAVGLKKLREVHYGGHSGFDGKVATGTAQAITSRTMDRVDKRLGFLGGLAELLSGPFWVKMQALVLLVILEYTVTVMLFGISPLTAFKAALITTLVGVGVIGQAEGFGVLFKNVLERPALRSIWEFIKETPIRMAFHISLLFTKFSGFFQPVHKYFASGRGEGVDMMEFDNFYQMFGKSHVLISLGGLALTGSAFALWFNSTFFFSIASIMSFVFGLVTATLLRPGALPIGGVTPDKVKELSKEFSRQGRASIKKTFTDNIHRKKLTRARVEAWGLTWKEATDKLPPDWIIKKAEGQIVFSTSMKRAREEFLEGDLMLPLIEGSSARQITQAVVGSALKAVVLGTVSAISGAANLLWKLKRRPNNEGGMDDMAMTISQLEQMAPLDEAVTVDAAPGGIDLGKTLVRTQAPGGGIQLEFNDPAMLRLLLNADGLTPIIYNINVMTPAMVNQFVGIK